MIYRTPNSPLLTVSLKEALENAEKAVASV